MMSKIRNYAQSAKGRVVMLLGTLAMVAVATFVVAAIPAHAGADATFTPLVTLVTGYMTGSLGLLLSLAGALFGLVSVLSGRYGQMAAGFAMAAGFFYIPAILPTIVAGLV
ncbi:MAG: hypothetical protein NTZ28_01205 [Nitrospirae bacterium]|nr:hypothetical protein [Nitrospiraceae bacterium]MCX5727459.1 hypothetical protein [Nitrospirota bacterium]NOS83323.1 hypothetical protein [Nitrospira sp.]TKB71357.1 MAG: hypothetical protein E8D46_18495 [Nitrospira sp.]